MPWGGVAGGDSIETVLIEICGWDIMKESVVTESRNYMNWAHQRRYEELLHAGIRQSKTKA